MKQKKNKPHPENIVLEVISVDWLREMFKLMDGHKTEAEMKLNEF